LSYCDKLTDSLDDFGIKIEKSFREMQCIAITVYLQEKEAEDWIENRNPDFVPLVLAFKIQDDSIYPANTFTEAVKTAFSDSKWWQVMEKKAEKSARITVEFCRLMRGLHSAPASSGSLERIFSTFGHVVC